MYKIEVIVRPDRVGSVKKALVDQGIREFIVADVHGYGSQPVAVGCYRGATFELPAIQQTRFEFSVPDTSLTAAIDSIIDAADTGEPGDGKIFVTPVLEAIEISLGTQSVPQFRPRPRLAATIGAEWPNG